MTLDHELINYTDDLIPVKWIIHNATNSVGAILPHWHTSFEITYLYSGEIESFTINKKTYPASPGAIFLVNSTEVHASVSSYCADLEALTIQIPYDFMKKLIPNFEYSRFINYPAADENKVNQLRESLSEFYQLVLREPEEFLRLQLLRLTYEIIYILAKNWMVKEGTPINSNLYNQNLGEIQPIVSYIQEYYDQNLSVSAIAENFHLSPNYLSKFFKKNLGMSVMKYVQLVRINKAQRLILYSDKPIHVISDIVGFPNEKSFRKSFIEVFNKTPKKYQLEHTKNKKS